MKNEMQDKEKVKKAVRQRYGEIARKESSCCGGGTTDAARGKGAASGATCGCGAAAPDISKLIGYSDEELDALPEGADLGLGCGNPVALASLKKGETVLDLGSGAGIDCFLAAKKVGPKGNVIGVDMTHEMLEKAKKNASKGGYKNVEFRLGEIEELPVDDKSIDVIISNCVINLSPDKQMVFDEAYRVLKKGGEMFVSDIVLLKELSEAHRKDKKLIAGCVGGAVLKEEYLKLVKNAGFAVKILSEDKEISERQYDGFPLESLRIAAYK